MFFQTHVFLISFIFWNCPVFVGSVENFERDIKKTIVQFRSVFKVWNLILLPNLQIKSWMFFNVCMAIRQKKNVDLLSGFWRSLEKYLRFFALLLTLKNPHTCCLWGNDFFLFIQFTHLWPCCSPSNRTLKKTVEKKTLLCRYVLIVL